jgi:hypothetical protein
MFFFSKTVLHLGVGSQVRRSLLFFFCTHGFLDSLFQDCLALKLQKHLYIILCKIYQTGPSLSSTLLSGRKFGLFRAGSANTTVCSILMASTKG